MKINTRNNFIPLNAEIRLLVFIALVFTFVKALSILKDWLVAVYKNRPNFFNKTELSSGLIGNTSRIAVCEIPILRP